MKWAVRGPRGWTARGAVPTQDIGTLAVRDWQTLERPARAIGVNVAGEAARVRVEGQLARWRLPVEWLTATAEGGGVTNGYETPSQLGPDRWVSLIAARRRALAANESIPRACVVVNAGTAVTIDALDENGVFHGGMILPGMRLMREALVENTAGLKVPAGGFKAFPDNTTDAIHTGSIQAICGAIEQMRRQIDSNPAQVRCYLSGGAAADIGEHIHPPVEVVDTLVLEGVLALAEEVE
jgi:type III pantothenate kinase